MAATKEGEELEQGYGLFTDIFRIIIATNFAKSFMNFWNPNAPELALGSLWGLHSKYESQYQGVTDKFYTAFRMNETGLVAPIQLADQKNTLARVTTNYMIHGPQAIKKKELLLGKSFTEFSPTQKMESVNNLSNSMVNQTLMAPRANLMETMKNDPEVSRYIRKADSSACDFCKMLVSRGGVYLESTSKFRSHGNCGCTAIPIYKGYRVPAESEEAAKRWMEAHKGSENKRIRGKSNKYAVEQGLVEKKETTFTDKNGNEATRTDYVDTEKGKQAKKDDYDKAMKNLDELKRDGAAYKKPLMTEPQRRVATEERLATKKLLQARRMEELDKMWAEMQ